MTEDVRAARHELGLTQAAFARALETTARNVRKWEAGEVSPSGPARVAIRLLLAEHRRKPPYSVIDLETHDTFGMFDTLTEAHDRIRHDGLKAFAIFREGVMVEADAPDDVDLERLLMDLGRDDETDPGLGWGDKSLTIADPEFWENEAGT